MAGYGTLKREIMWWHVIALCIIIAAVLLMAWTVQQQDRQLRAELLTKATIAAVNIDPAMVESLHGSPSDIDSPDYQHLKIQMAQIRAADPSIRFVYLMGQRPEEIFFYVDSEPADSGFYSPPGQVYPEATVLLNTAFSDKMPMTEGPIPDSYGTWVSATVPITDKETGHVVALMGIDVDAGYWNYDIARACADIIAASLLLLVLVITFGLTQRRNQREQRRLSASEDKFSRTFHTNPALMAISLLEGGRFLDVNTSFLATIGYSREEVIGRTPSDLGLYSDPAQWGVIQGQLEETGQVDNVDVKLNRKDHYNLDGLFSGTKIDVAGLPCLLLVIHDITERRRVEASLRESEEQSRTISNSILFGIAIMDSVTHAIIDVNDKALEMIGAGRDIVVGSVCHQFICPAGPGKCPVTDMGQMVNCSDRVLLNFRGERIPIFKSVVRTTLRGKDVLIESFVDITERKQAENALRESERTIRNLLNAVPDDLALINHERTIIAVNESMAKTLGQPPEALAGRPIGDVLTSPVLSETLDRISDPTMTGGRQVYFEEKQDDRWLETSVYPVTDRNRTDVKIVIQSRDITHQKQIEEELKKAGLSQVELNIEKFQILNDQIRNPLQVIRGYLALGPEEYQDEINKQVEIIDHLVTELDMGWLESEKVQQFLIKHSHCSTRSFPEQHQEDGLQ